MCPQVQHRVSFYADADANGCANELQATIKEPEALVAKLGSVVDNKCYGDELGAIIVEVAGGVKPYKYNWSNGDTSQNVTNLSAGNYSVEITDAKGCVQVVDAYVGQPELLASAIADISHISCFNEKTGKVDIDVEGGTEPYTFAWSTGATTKDIENVPAGTYTFSVHDAQGCESALEAVINQPDLLTLEVDTVHHIMCNGEGSGFIDVNVSGGVFPYAYSWSNGTISEDLVNVLAGTYALEVKDANGCSQRMETEIVEPEKLVVRMDSLSDVECAGQAAGYISLIAEGGQAPYSYRWNTGQTTRAVENITAGRYQTTVTDANGCITSFTSVVSEPENLISTVDAITNIRCYGEESGSISVTALRGSAPYTFEWSNGATTEDLRGVPAGDYTLKITEAN